MVECVFYNVADRFRKPGPVTGEKNGIIPRERQFLSFPLSPVGKLFSHLFHHIRKILFRFFKHDRSGIQPGNLQQILNQCLDPVKFLLGKNRKFPDRSRIFRFFLCDSIVNIQRRQGSLQLV